MAFRTPYTTEREGQAEFFDSYGIPYTGDDSVLIDNTDGVYNGCIIEFKLNISSLNKVLFQAVKYLSRMRVRGESVPATIILVDLNKTTAYIYESEDYRDAIHRTYAGAASKDNSGFAARSYNSVIDYSTMEGASDLRKLLRGKKKDPDEMYIPISIDESCIIGWAERYYREVPNASKGDFLGDGTGRINLTGEIRDPRHFRGLIVPYKEKTNERFAYLMDCLNSRLAKKDLGAFYTPEPYARKAAELVQKAVERVPEGNDYVIIDRCYDKDTEYLSPDGWKKISEYNGGKVMQYNEDGTADFVEPLRYIMQPYTGNWITYKSSQIDFKVTSNHDMVVIDHYKKKLQKVPAQKLYEQQQVANNLHFVVPKTFRYDGDITLDEDMLRLAVAINADGTWRPSCTIEGNANRTSPNTRFTNADTSTRTIWSLKLHKQRKIDRIHMLLEKAGIPYKESTYMSHGDLYHEIIFSYSYIADPKHFPKGWYHLSYESKRVIAEEILYWDGSIQTRQFNWNANDKKAKNYSYSTSKKEDADFIEFVFASLGYGINYRTDIRNNKPNCKTNYALRFNKITTALLKKHPKDNGIQSIPAEENDMCFCFTVPSGMLVVRRNNKIFISGNCAGTGSLESALIGLKDKNGDELISHCVASTYEYYEAKVMMERIGDLVRDIIPPTEANICFENGVVSNADAMSEEYINNPIIRKYVEDEKCTIILYENVPFQDSTSVSSRNATNNCAFAKTRAEKFVASKMRNSVKNRDAVRDLANQFIWSGFEYYLRQPTDSYIVFSPIKYWKYVGLAEKDFISGYIFNRAHFHATASSIGCILWANTNNNMVEKLTLPAFDIDDEDNIKYEKDIVTSKCKRSYDFFKNKGVQLTDVETSVHCERDGSESSKKADCKAYYNDNIIAFLGVPSFAIDPALCRILIRQNYFHHGMGYYIRKNDYLNHLPFFVGKSFPIDKWYDKDVYATTSDGGDAYTHDESFLKSCLLYTVLSNQNKCLSFWGSDGRYYRNELTLDDTNGETVASSDLTRLFAKYPPDCEEQKLINLWGSIMEEATATDGYDSSITYGVYQIAKELNTFTVTGSGRSKRKVYNYPDLNGNLDALRTTLKEYYKSHITEQMFKYQLLK